MAKKKGPNAGRAKQKHKSQRSTNGDASWSSPMQGRRFTVDSDDDDDGNDNDAPHTMFRGFDGSTTRHYSSMSPAISLRHRSIAFVSAGTNTTVEFDIPIKKDELVVATATVASSEAEGDRVQPVKPATPEIDVVAESLEIQCQISGLDGSSDAPGKLQDETLGFAIDTTGDASLSSSAKAPRAIQRSPSPTPSSDEDVIVFRGRNKATVIEDPIAAPIARKQHLPPHLQPRSVQERSNNFFASAKNTSEGSTEPTRSTTVNGKSDSDWTPAPSGAWWRKDKASAGAASVPIIEPTQEVEDAAREGAEVTIAVLQAAWAQQKRTDERERTARVARGMPAFERAPQKLSRRDKRARQRDQSLLNSLTADISDPEEAAFQDYMDNLKKQDTGSTSAVDDAEVDAQIQLKESAMVDNAETSEWADTDASESDQDSDSQEQIGHDLEEVYGLQPPLEESELDSSDLEEQIEEAERDIMQTEDELHNMRLRSMTDEQVARLWQKQHELGIEADELLIDDGEISYVDHDGGFGDISAARAGIEEYIKLPGSGKKDRKSRRRQDPSFPDASALADAVEQYGNDGFDIMDLDRPSLRPMKKGRKGKMPPELEAISDEEQRDHLRSAWDNDRAKKRVKKQEREELRMQGLLGARNKGKADFDQKYRQGMTMVEIQLELEDFMENEGQTTRAFPPMDKADRKALHEVANMLGLKSKSVGTGDNRAPVLYKTKATRRYDSAALERAMRMADRRFLRNQSFKGKVAKKGAAPVKRSGGAGTMGLRHGELVGAGAQEIGRDNFGSKLMEKMGWTRGTALGKDGEGLLHPVEQVMRIGKAGLG